MATSSIQITGDFLATYTQQLQKLGKRPDKLLINALTLSAQDVLNQQIPNTNVNASTLLNSIFKRILKTEVENKVPLWYLLDSILFNVGGAYLSLTNKQLPVMFQDTYKSVGEDDKQRLNKLLYRWEQRQNFLDPKVLHETRARMHPEFTIEGYRQHLAQKEQRQQQKQLTSSNNLALRQAKTQPLLQNQVQTQKLMPMSASTVSNAETNYNVGYVGGGLMPLSAAELYSEQQFAELVYGLAERSLKEKQIDIPENLQLPLDTVKALRPEMYLELVKEAVEFLEQNGVRCVNSNFMALSGNQPDEFKLAGEIKEVNWDLKFLKSGVSRAFVVANLFGLGNLNGKLLEKQSGLYFASETARDIYLNKVKMCAQLPNNIFLLEQRLAKQAHRSRAWFIPCNEWIFDEGYKVNVSSKSKDERRRKYKQRITIRRDFDSKTKSKENDSDSIVDLEMQQEEILARESKIVSERAGGEDSKDGGVEEKHGMRRFRNGFT